MRNKAITGRKTIIKIIKTPIMALCKAKDLYIKGIISFSATYNRPLMTMEASESIQKFPRSFSVADSDLYKIREEHQEIQDIRTRQVSRVARSCSVGMGTIDEDRVSSFRNDNIFHDKHIAS